MNLLILVGLTRIYTRKLAVYHMQAVYPASQQEEISIYVCGGYLQVYSFVGGISI